MGIPHLKRSCGNMPLKIIRRPNISTHKVHGEDVSEAIKVFLLINVLQRTSRQDKMMSSSWNNLKEDEDMETTKCKFILFLSE